MKQEMFSWQENDYHLLRRLLMTGTKILLLHDKDYESPYHVISVLCGALSEYDVMPLQVEVNPAQPPYPLLPFSKLVSTVTENAQKRPLLPTILKDITKSDTIEAIAEDIVGCNRHTSLALDAYKNDLMVRLESVVGDARPVFLFRGFDCFDQNSQELALLLVSGQLNPSFPFLEDAAYLFLIADHDTTTARRVDSFEHIDIRLTTPGPENMAEIMEEIAPELTLSEVDQAKLFCLSGGRLSYIEYLTNYLSEKSFVTISAMGTDIIASTLSERISGMGESGCGVQSILEYAANIGSSFFIPLLERASEAALCRKALCRSDRELLTRCGQTEGEFLCHEVWDYFYSCPNVERKRKICKDLERGIYYFNPYDYYTRAYYLEQAGCDRAACELYFYAYHTMVREGLQPKSEWLDKIEELSRKTMLSPFWKALRLAHLALESCDFKRGINALSDMDMLPSLRLLLLKEYLMAMLLYRSSSEADQREAVITMQEAVKHARDIEEGFWCDCQTTLISFVINKNGETEAARRICKELIYYYTQKSYARFARKGLYALKRKWAALYSAETAVKETLCSVRFFRSGIYPSQYLMALNNHAANLIVLDHFEEAMCFLNEAIGVLRQLKTVSVNRMYILNNYCLCAMLLQKISPFSAYQIIQKVLDGQPEGDCDIILRLNGSVYLALSGRLGDAERHLRDLERIGQKINDDYYLFYIYANLAAVLYLTGRRTDAVKLLSEKCVSAPVLFKASEKIYMEDRTKLWIEVMQNKCIDDPQLFDTYLLRRHPERTQWGFVGRGFLYSDIQFWSEP